MEAKLGSQRFTEIDQLAAGPQIFDGRVLAEKNLKMLELAKLADQDKSGSVLRKLKDGQEPRNGFEAVSYFEAGVPMHLEVDPAKHKGWNFDVPTELKQVRRPPTPEAPPAGPRR